MAGKRKGGSSASKSTKKARTDEDSENGVPFVNWRVVLTGEFTMRSKEDLEDALKEREVVITGAISGKTTHLVLGSKSAKAQFGGVSGVGGSKHAKAMSKGIPIVSEASLWAVIDGKADKVEILEDGGVNDPNHKIDGQIASFSEKEKKERLGLPEKKVKGSKWLGVMLNETKDATGRVNCRICETKIEKGEKQVSLHDDSMFKCVGGKTQRNGRFEAVNDVPGLDTVNKSVFWVRQGCIDKAVDMCKEKFEREYEIWKQAKEDKEA